jgi:hypothetical protein
VHGDPDVDYERGSYVMGKSRDISTFGNLGTGPAPRGGFTGSVPNRSRTRVAAASVPNDPRTADVTSGDGMGARYVGTGRKPRAAPNAPNVARDPPPAQPMKASDWGTLAGQNHTANALRPALTDVAARRRRNNRTI